MASDSKPEGSMLWGGRFTGGHPLMVKYNESIFFDRVLYKQDILGSIAFARANAKSGIKEWETDSFTIISGVDEDIHTANERRLGDMMAEELGFEGLLWNSMGGVADRDFVSEFLHYNTVEFGFVRLSDAYSTGSSLMPQKKNADSLELLRRKAGRAFGHMAGFMMTQKGLPSTYNKDLQESLEPMMDHVKTVSDSIQIANGVLATLAVNAEKMKAALDPFMLATDVADYLVRKGVPFRETHHISGRCVAKSEETGIPMNEFSYEQIKAIDERFEEDIADVFNYETSVESRSAKGGTSKATVLEQIEVLREMLA
ncbi:hypothetical protein CDV31_009296 [Fusarium ambrosium]|uniref:Arginosuccinase n=1 Tax=Fusarium ambrosium TaxID=131363 RepID=A0A428TVN9_9HYPO|nr:hypothetical protein CDV31_009296 [Fusarium ambrosium]